MKSVGICTLDVECIGQRVQADFHVVDPIRKKAPPILGLSSCLNSGLIKLVDAVTLTPSTSGNDRKPLGRDTVLKEYKDIFTGIGLFPGEVSVELDPSIPSYIHPPPRVPQVI